MTRLEAIKEVLKDNVRNIVDHSELEYTVLAKLIGEAIDRIELEEAAEYANDFLETFQDRKGLQ